MFRVSDKIGLSIINARDIDGNILPFSLKLPLNESFSIPDELVSVDVFENHEGLITGGNVAFKICIGRATTLKELVSEHKKIKTKKNLYISSIDDSICIQDGLEEQVIFATLFWQDIVVENKEQLVKVIEMLSDSFKVVDDSVTKIRTLYKRI